MSTPRRRYTRRTFLGHSLAATAVFAAPGLVRRSMGSLLGSGPVRVGVIGVRGRGRGHIAGYLKSPDAEVVAICDPDSGVIGGAMGAVPEAKYHKDIRRLLDDDSIDAVSIATPNHWHSLAAIWALQAGKHVYVEKPVSHNPFEGRMVVLAQKKYGKVLQHGTQARSHPAVRDALQWLQEGNLGEVKLARGLCYKRRKSIGKVDGPQTPPATCDYDLWTGPAPMQELMRKNLHYDWHWVWETGNGDVGNQGVHQMDLAVWGMDLERMPASVESIGGRFGYDDDGTTHNTQVSLYSWHETDKRVIFEVRGLETPANRGVKIGTIYYGERGYLAIGSYGKVTAYDYDGGELETFRGGSEQLHYQNFLDAIKASDPTMVNAPAHIAHVSAALCHHGNASARLGQQMRFHDTDAPFGEGEPKANDAFVRFRDHLMANGMETSTTKYLKGPKLPLNGDGQAIGEHAEAAKPFLTRAYRAPFVVPAEV